MDNGASRARNGLCVAAAAVLVALPSVASAQVAARLQTVGKPQVSGTPVASPASLAFTGVPVTAGNRLVVELAARGTTAITLTELAACNGATCVALGLDAGPVTNTTGNGITLWVYSGEITSAITTVTSYRATFTGTTTRIAAIGTEYSGLTRQATAIDVAGSNTQNSTTSVTFASANVDTTRPNTFLVAAFAAASSVSNSHTFSGTNFTLAKQEFNTNLQLSMFHGDGEVSSAASTYNGTTSAIASANTASILVAYNAVPNQVETTNAPTTLDAGVCSAAFSFRLRSDNAQVPPLTGTTITATSSDPGAQVRIGSCPAGGETNSDSVVLDDATSTLDVFITQTTGGTGFTLSIEGDNGGVDALVAAVESYDVNAPAATQYCLELPGQTFVPGQCTVSGYCLFTDTPTAQVANVPFNARVIAVDATCNPAAPSVNPVNVTWDGFSLLAGDGSAASAPTTLTFDGNGETTISLTFVVGEQATPYFTDDAALFGLSMDADENFHIVNVTVPANTTTLAISNPAATTPQRVGYSARADGEVEIRITNGTGGGINRVEIEDPTTMGDWSATTSSVWNSTGTTQVMSGWTMSLQGTTLRFQASSSATFPNGATLRFRARLATGTYPNLSSAQTFTQTVRYTGFQSCTTASCLGASPANQFTVRPPLPAVNLPTVARSASFALPRFNWTNTDSVPTSRSGVMVVRGTATPADTRSYAVGDEVATGSRVVCRVTGSTTTCDDSPGGGNDLADASTATYRVYQFDTFNGYSSGVALSVPARPATGFVYRHTGTGLGTGSDPEDNEAGGGAAPGASPGYVVFTSQTNNAVYVVRNDGTEQRRPTTTVNNVAKRASAVRLQDNSYAIFAADSGTRAYRINPGDNSAATQSTLGAAVSAGPHSINSNTLTALNAAFNGDGVIFATNGGSNNIVRGYRTSLGLTAWTYNLADTTDGVSADAYTFIQNNTNTGIMMVPAGFGTGGIYGIDLVNYSGAGSPQPSGWSGVKILSGTQFRAQCRRFAGNTNVVCGDVNGTLHVVNPTTGASVGSTFSTGSQSILAVVPVTGQSMVYVTRSPDGAVSAHVGRATFNGSTFTSDWDITVPSAPVLSGPALLFTQNVLFVTGDASATTGTGGSIFRINLTSGAVENTVALDGDDVSDPVYNVSNDTVAVQTDNGSIWSRPRTSL